MIPRSIWLALPTAWLGSTLLLSRVRSIRAVSISERLRPTVGGIGGVDRSPSRSSSNFLESVLSPLAVWIGGRVNGALGVRADTARRLERIGDPSTLSEFRVRQLSTGVAGAAALGLGATAVGLHPFVALLGAGGAFLLGFLVVEQHLANRSEAWQRRLTMELPVVVEQLGMLLSAGSSLSGALARLAQRSNGICAHGFVAVNQRIRQGLGDIAALREWASVADVVALDRLIAVLALNREATDLGGLISAEARNIRAQSHRGLLELIEKRGQQVWIPVTVATLLPGVMFMAVPFLDAMHQLTGGT